MYFIFSVFCILLHHTLHFVAVFLYFVAVNFVFSRIGVCILLGCILCFVAVYLIFSCSALQCQVALEDLVVFSRNVFLYFVLVYLSVFGI